MPPRLPGVQQEGNRQGEIEGAQARDGDRLEEPERQKVDRGDRQEAEEREWQPGRKRRRPEEPDGSRRDVELDPGRPAPEKISAELPACLLRDQVGSVVGDRQAGL